MGQGFITGSNTPWAQGPANFIIIPYKPTGSQRQKAMTFHFDCIAMDFHASSCIFMHLHAFSCMQGTAPGSHTVD